MRAFDPLLTLVVHCGWRLWREISGKPAKGRVGDQADLFAAAGARYHGGPERRDGWRR
jgi:hypothetical protein